MTLQSTYNRPFPVAARNSKFFAVLIKNKNINISIDRLKPPQMVNEDFQITLVSVPGIIKKNNPVRFAINRCIHEPDGDRK